MATTLLRLQTREARKRLEARDAPYYFELRRGLSLGYRKGVDGASWLMRERRGGHYAKRRLGAADDDVSSDGVSVLSWAEAQAAALGSERPTVTRPTKLRVRDAWQDYGTTRGTPITAAELATWQTFIEESLGDKVIADLATGDLEAWLARQATTHGQRRKDAETDPRERRRKAQATANRRWRLLRAILNSAFRKSHDRVPSDAAWRRVKAFARADQPRLRVLSAAEAQRLLNALAPPIRALARGALFTGCRLGELLALTVSDVNGNEVNVRQSTAKSGKARTVPLSPEGAAFFEGQAAGRSGAIFEPVGRVALSRAMAAASAVAKLTPPARFHDLRRSYGSLLINAGVPLESIRELLGHADLRMTTRVYAHLKQASLRKAVAKLPDFGGAESGTVVPMKRRGK